MNDEFFMMKVVVLSPEPLLLALTGAVLFFSEL